MFEKSINNAQMKSCCLWIRNQIASIFEIKTWPFSNFIYFFQKKTLKKIIKRKYFFYTQLKIYKT